MSGGPMMAGKVGDKRIDLISVFEALGSFKAGQITEEELTELEDHACPAAARAPGCSRPIP